MRVTRACLVVARHDFVDTVSRPSFLATLVALPLLLFVSATALLPGAKSAKRSLPIALVAPTDFTTSPPPGISIVSSIAEGDRMLLQKRVGALFIVGDNYRTNGAITVKHPPLSPLRPPSSVGFPEVERFLRQKLMASSHDAPSSELMNDPLMRVRRLTPQSFSQSDQRRYITPAFLSLMLIMLISFSSSYLLHSVSLERENRMIEVVLTAVSPQDFLFGKILGLTSASLVHPSLLLALGGGRFLQPGELIGGTMALVWSLVFALGGLIFMACVMAATGMLLDAGREAQHLSLIWTIWMFLPIGILATIPDWNDSLSVRVLSIFPFSLPLVMILRLGFSAVPIWDIATSGLCLMGATVVAFWVAVKLVKLSLALRGKRLTWTTLASLALTK